MTTTVDAAAHQNRRARAFFLHVAVQPLSPAILGRIREMVRTELAHEGRERLETKAEGTA